MSKQKSIMELLEEVSERMIEAEKNPVGLSDCHSFPAYIAPPGDGIRTRWYACSWCGKACGIKKGREGD